MIFKRKTMGISLAVIAAAVLVYFLAVKRQPAKAAGSSTSSPAGHQVQKTEEAPIPVKVVDAKKGDLVIRLKSPGEAVTDWKIIMKTEVEGVVKGLKAREGLHVKAGDTLVRIDDERYRLALERQEAFRLKLLSEMLLEKQFGQSTPPLGAAPEKVAKAKKEFAAVEAGFRKGLATQADFEKASKEYEAFLIEAGLRKEEVMAASKGLTQAEIDVKTAGLDLEKTTIKAPFAGIVTEIKVSPGEHLEPGRDLFMLVNIREIKVTAKVLESEVGKMRIGREVDLRFSAYPDKVFKGTVEAVSPIVNPEDRTCAVRIAVDNAREEIKPGMHAEVEIAAEVYKDRLLVPQEAVLVRGGRKLVFVVEEGLAKWRYIEVGLENETYAEILDGIKEGEKVIVEGHFTLAHDARVSVTR